MKKKSKKKLVPRHPAEILEGLVEIPEELFPKKLRKVMFHIMIALIQDYREYQQEANRLSLEIHGEL